jgi:putative heme-binding domain-containing protein
MRVRSRARRGALYRAAWAVGLLAASCAAQEVTAEDVAAGGRLYASHCAECHGAAGEGGRGPKLTAGVFYHGSSDEALFQNIQRGIPGTEMPGTYHEGRQIRQLAAYVRSLSARRTAEGAKGDAQRGAALYRQSGCGACHSVQGEGGRLGPELTYIGSARSAAHLRRSIVEPAAEVAQAWWPVEVETNDGATHRGYLLSEDSFHLRLIDEREALRSVERATIRRFTVGKGKTLMPSYAGKLSDTEMEDLLAWLSGLRRATR